MFQFSYKIKFHPRYWLLQAKWVRIRGLFAISREGVNQPSAELIMVSIRLSRGGAKKRPFYHIVVTDSRCRRDGRYIERIGFFNPVATQQEVGLNVNHERADYWLSQGANASERVAHLIKQSKKQKAAAVGIDVSA